MNQAIQFDNELTIIDNSVRFNAQQQGQVLVCVVSFADLQALNQQLNYANEVVSSENALQVFESLRFDIEELAEQQILDEQVNGQGEVHISA
ncbi:DUF1488 domain-containing protein [Shewanella sp. WXL01]|uniref:DUF1488 domain-containing protein n=1 Tax=Shewanella maritima TaxID=2520507 RepID=A0A411PHZ9_9GAMM|nr:MULTISPECIES: DUF1488 domain-containing protein [Shewanella]NKF51832.1 DUF1488 domain-containing protein [Shewanella sp. WXL01]QBF83084.1 DUF1488 domain-containing protein [Shewanella maritima]